MLPENDINNPEEMMNEMINLAKNLDIKVLGSKIINIKKINSATLIGSGTLKNLLNREDINDLNLLILRLKLLIEVE